jgi:fatty acid desaturase
MTDHNHDRDKDQDEEARILRDTVRGFPMEWFVQDEWRMCRQGLGDLAVLAAGAWLVLSVGSPWLCVPVWIVMAGRMHALGVLMHDLSHVRHLERQLLKRVLIDAVVCYPILMNMDYYGYAHTLHHQWSNVPGKDPYFFPLNRMSTPRFLGFVLFSTLFLPAWLTLRLVTFPLALVVPAVRRFHARYFTQFGAAADLDSPGRLGQGEKVWIWGLGPCVFWWAVAGLLWHTGQWAAFGWACGIPIVLSALIGQVRLACDHVYEEARDNSIPEQLAGSTNIEAPWWQEVILAPHGAGYHGMHHVAPNVPNWNWKEAHRRLKASGSRVYASTIYSGYGAILLKLLSDQRAWARRQPAGGAIEVRPPPADAPEPGFRDLPLVSLGEGYGDRAHAPPLITVPPVQEINAESRARAFRIEDLDWRPADRDRWFAPECMSHLYFTPVYQELTPEERLGYNQAFAEGISEQFVFLEQVLLVRGLKSFLLRCERQLPQPMVEACQFFIQEEDKHSEMFRRLLVEANPAVYEKETFHVYRLDASERRFMDRSMEDPTFYLWWIWVATLFEEKTIDFHRKYQNERDRVDPMYASVHRHHCLDELRHLQMDHHFVEALWVPAPAWKKALNVHMLQRIMWSFVHPRRTVVAAVGELVKRHTRLEPMRDRLVREGMGVASLRAWHEATYSRQTLPNTFALFDRFPELHGMSTVLPLYRPRPERQEAQRRAGVSV